MSSTIAGVKDGEKFFRVAREVSKKKLIIAIKGGLTEEGSKAALSHTATLAGKKEVYFGVFKQAGIIHADSLHEMFNIASLIEKEVFFKGDKIQIITNGGGYGIISTDNIIFSKTLKLAQLSRETEKKLRQTFPKKINIRNPLDLVGDATTEIYKIALENCINDKNVDAVLLIVLYQTPLISNDIVEVISELRRETKKPIVVVSTGGEFTEKFSKYLEQEGLPTFSYPEDAVKAIDKVVWYQEKRKKL